MKKILTLFIISFIFIGCSKFKGAKGDTGAQGIQGLQGNSGDLILKGGGEINQFQGVLVSNVFSWADKNIINDAPSIQVCVDQYGSGYYITLSTSRSWVNPQLPYVSIDYANKTITFTNCLSSWRYFIIMLD